MKFLFALYRYFPWGGLQKDTLRFAKEAVKCGHQPVILAAKWEGPPPPDGIQVILKPVHAFTNAGLMENFRRAFADELATGHYDASLAMNRIPGADCYFAADLCMALWMARKHSRLTLALLPRYRTYLAHEAAICAPSSHTTILYIAPTQKIDFMTAYHLPESRFKYLPPGMDPRCRRPANAEARRNAKRTELGLNPQDIAIIEVGTNLWGKGVDRAIASIAALPPSLRSRSVFFLAGIGNPYKVNRLAQKMGMRDKVNFLGPRDDVPDLLLASDIMLHPAREEATGTVLIEALAAGLPVICTDACGFAPFVHDATATTVPEPFNQATLNSLLAKALTQLPDLAAQTLEYALSQDFIGRDRAAIAALEAVHHP